MSFNHSKHQHTLESVRQHAPYLLSTCIYAEDPSLKPKISCWYWDHWLTYSLRRLAFSWWIMNENG